MRNSRIIKDRLFNTTGGINKLLTDDRLKKELLKSYRIYSKAFKISSSVSLPEKEKEEKNIIQEIKDEEYFKILNILKSSYKKYFLSYKPFV